MHDFKVVSRCEQVWRRVEVALPRHPVVALLGPRQCGKTTLARHFLPPDHPGTFDLEDPVVTALMENWNGAEIAASMGVSPNTVRAYLDALEQTYMIRRLLPWHANLAKRIVKSPKIYFRDTGILHALLGVRSAVDLRVHPKLGASWEGFALEQVVRATRPDRVHFHAVHSGSEIDLLLERGGQRWAVEFQRSDAPTATRSLKTAMHDLDLDQAWIVYPGSRSYRIDERIEVRPLASFATPASVTSDRDDAGS